MDVLFLTNKREVSAEWHLKQVLKWLDFDNGRELDNVLVSLIAPPGALTQIEQRVARLQDQY